MNETQTEVPTLGVSKNDVFVLRAVIAYFSQGKRPITNPVTRGLVSLLNRIEAGVEALEALEK